MPRTKRLVSSSLAMHVICRGNNRQIIFKDQNDKERYYSLLFNLKQENNISIFHYCFMDNHVHLILWLSVDAMLSRFMKQVNLSYVHHYRRRYGYSGHFWQDRFKSNIIDLDSYLLQCGKYIELNPVRAGIVTSPWQYRFSSYRHYAYGRPDLLVADSPAYLGLSQTEEGRRKSYIDFVVDERMINHEFLMKRLFLGSENFVKKLQEYYSIRSEKRKRGRPKNPRK